MIDAEINRQAMFIAYMDVYWVMMWTSLAVLPLLLLLRRPSPVKQDEQHLVLE